MGLFDIFKKKKIDKEICVDNILFVYNKLTKEYEAVIDGIAISVEQVDIEKVRYAKTLVSEYKNNITKIVDFLMADEDYFGVKNGFYPNLTKEKLTRSLNLPSIYIIEKNNCEISYLDHTLDDEHCINFEVDGVFENLSNLSIDG